MSEAELPLEKTRQAQHVKRKILTAIIHTEAEASRGDIITNQV